MKRTKDISLGAVYIHAHTLGILVNKKIIKNKGRKKNDNEKNF